MIQGVPIGAAADATGVKVPTIRYYEQIGLLSAPDRTAGNRRYYRPADLKRLSFIRHARELGFDVEAIRTLLTLQDDPDQSCSAADAVARAHLVDIRKRIASLAALEKELERMVDHCARGKASECRVIEILADQTHDHGRLI